MFGLFLNTPRISGHILCHIFKDLDIEGKNKKIQMSLKEGRKNSINMKNEEQQTV